jgi:hypothetical protein
MRQDSIIGMYLKKFIPIKMAEFFIPFSQIEVVLLWKFDSRSFSQGLPGLYETKPSITVH